MTPKQRRAYGREFERINRKFEVKYYPRVLKTFTDKISSLIELLQQQGPQAAIDTLSTDLTNPGLTKVVQGLYREVGLRHARREYRRQRMELRAEGRQKSLNIHHKQLVLVDRGEVSTSAAFNIKAFGFNERWTAFILQYLQQFLLQKITFAVQRTLRDKILDILQQGVAEGWGVDEMVKRLQDSPFARYQAARIVRTEVNRAANVGTMASVETAEYEMNKEWIAAKDRRTRGNPYNGNRDHADHWSLDGKIVGYEEAFRDPRSGEQLQFPGDPNASGASTINCRCSVAPIAKRDENGRLVPKPQPAAQAPVVGLYKPPVAAGPSVGVTFD